MQSPEDVNDSLNLGVLPPTKNMNRNGSEHRKNFGSEINMNYHSIYQHYNHAHMPSTGKMSN